MREKVYRLEMGTYRVILLDIAANQNNGVGDFSIITNDQLADLMFLSQRTIVRHIRKLEKLGYIDVSYKGRRRIIKKGGIN